MDIIIRIGRLTIVLFHIEYERKQPKGDCYTNYIKDNFDIDLTKRPVPTGNLGEQLNKYKSLVNEVNNASNK